VLGVTAGVKAGVKVGVKVGAATIHRAGKPDRHPDPGPEAEKIKLWKVWCSFVDGSEVCSHCILCSAKNAGGLCISRMTKKLMANMKELLLYTPNFVEHYRV